jgi:hypothetical protein
MSNVLGYGYIQIKADGTFHPLKNLYLKYGSSWADVQTAWIKSQGEWVRVFPTPNAIPETDVSTLSFTTYTTFSSTSKSVSITNTGDEVLQITGTSESTSSKFKINADYSGLGIDGLPYIILPGNTKTFTVYIDGYDVGTDSATIVLNTNTGQFGAGEISINVSGESIPLYSSAIANTTAVDYVFNNESLNTAPINTVLAGISKTFQIKNVGNGVLTIDSFTSATGRTIITNVPSTIKPGKSAVITVTPSTDLVNDTVAEGTYTDTITMTSDSIGGDITITTSLEVVINHGVIAASKNAGSGSFTVPSNIFSIDIFAVGGGGSGGQGLGGPNGGGGGGGAGGTILISGYSVTPGQVITYNIGGGAAPNGYNTGSRGNNGGNTTILGQIAYGGGGGAGQSPRNGSAPGSPGGSGGGASASKDIYQGQAGGGSQGYAGGAGYGADTSDRGGGGGGRGGAGTISSSDPSGGLGIENPFIPGTYVADGGAGGCANYGGGVVGRGGYGGGGSHSYNINGTTPGSGGGGGAVGNFSYGAGSGADGAVYVRY